MFVIASFFIAQAQVKAPKRVSQQAEEAFVRKFVQRFYDWYGPAATHFFDNNGPVDPERIALKSKAEMFNPELRKLLLDDLRATDESKDGEAGIDYMPFFGAQDFCEHYSIPSVRRDGARWLVEVRGINDAHYGGSVPDLIAVVEKVNTKYGWRFANFIYDNNGRNLMSDLKEEMHITGSRGRRHKITTVH